MVRNTDCHRTVFFDKFLIDLKPTTGLLRVAQHKNLVNHAAHDRILAFIKIFFRDQSPTQKLYTYIYRVDVFSLHERDR